MAPYVTAGPCLLGASLLGLYLMDRSRSIVKPAPFKDQPLGSKIQWTNLQLALLNFSLGDVNWTKARPGCSLPLVDPWAPEILLWVTEVPPAPTTNPLLFTSMDRIHINTTRMRELGVRREDLHCIFSYLSPSGEEEVKHVLRDDMLVLRPRGWEDSLRASCWNDRGRTQLFDQILMFVRPPPKVPPPRKGQYSVALFVLDSMSQMNFVRSLPQTLALAEALGGSFFRGHHKLGPNSAPNIMAIMTGSEKGLECAIGKHCEAGRLVTNQYQDRGWTTLLIEDWVNVPWSGSALTFPSPEESPYKNNYGAAYWRIGPDRHKHAHTSPLSIMHDFLVSHKGVPTFLHSHICEYSHDHLNFIRNYDGDIADMLDRVSSAGGLNYTFFIIVGDHGFRFGDFPKTDQGNTEDNMPGLLVIPPTALASDHPDLARNLRGNTGVLTSHWDLALMLRQVLALSLGEDEEQLFHGMEVRGTSLLRKVPERTCSEAEVPMDFCSCTTGHMDLPPARVEGLVMAALEDIDNFLEPLWGCQKFQLHVADISRVSGRVEGEQAMVQAMVTLDLPPVEFRLKIMYEKKGCGGWRGEEKMDRMEVSVGVERMDQYSSTSACVPGGEASPLARPLCVCV